MILLVFLFFLSFLSLSRASPCDDKEACLRFHLCDGIITEIEYFNSTSNVTYFACAQNKKNETFEMHFRPSNAHDISIHIESSIDSLMNIQFWMNKVHFRFSQRDLVHVKYGNDSIGKEFTVTSDNGAPLVADLRITLTNASAFDGLKIKAGDATFWLREFTDKLRAIVPADAPPNYLMWTIIAVIAGILFVGGVFAACCFIHARRRRKTVNGKEVKGTSQTTMEREDQLGVVRSPTSIKTQYYTPETYFTATGTDRATGTERVTGTPKDDALTPSKDNRIRTSAENEKEETPEPPPTGSKAYFSKALPKDSKPKPSKE